MTVGGGRKYCGEHMVVAGEAEVRNLFYFWDIALVLRTASVQVCSSVFNIKNYYKFNVL